MRRDWDTIRSVLLAVEAGEFDVSRPIRLRQGDQRSAFHLRMLIDGGFVVTNPVGFGLTFRGEDLLDAIRHDRVWECCRAAIALNAGGLPSDVLLAIARKAIDLVAREV